MVKSYFSFQNSEEPKYVALLKGAQLIKGADGLEGNTRTGWFKIVLENCT